MNLNENNIEDFFKSNFENYAITPDSSVWNKIEKKIAFTNFLKFNPKQFNIYYLSAILLIVTTLLFPNLTSNNSAKANFSENIQEKRETAIEKIDNTQNKPIEIKRTDTNDKIIRKPIITKADAEEQLILDTNNSNTPDLSSEIIEIAEVVSELKPETSQDKVCDDTKTIAINYKVLAVELELSEKEGCVPLTVVYEVACEPTTSIKMDLGNGNFSINKQAVVTYDKPGTYVINIDAIGENKMTKKISDTIHVFAAPKPVAIIDADSECKENCIVYFYNYTLDGVKYTWDFGDQNYSLLEEPVHIYTQAGQQSIKLKVWSDKMCADSILIETPFSTISTTSIVFPNAFVPSTSGSNDGYYNADDYSIHVFYPVSFGVAKYKLEIYSRSGLLLFQTTDINQGWDGYYKYQLMPQDVYLWKATGQFENSDVFEFAGDVTLIRK